MAFNLKKFAISIFPMIFFLWGCAEKDHQPDHSSIAREASPLMDVAMEKEAVVDPLFPPFNAPVLSTLNTLKDSADGGNLRASCRLAVELDGCSQVLMQREALGNIGATGYAPSNGLAPISADMAASLLDTIEATESRCRGITERDLASAFTYQITSSRSSPELLRWLVRSPALNRIDFLQDLEEWAEYKRISENFVRHAIESGDPQNYSTLLLAYQPTSTLSRKIPFSANDDAMFIALVELGLSNGAQVPAEFVNTSNNLKSELELGGGIREAKGRLEKYGWINSNLSETSQTPYLHKATISLCN